MRIPPFYHEKSWQRFFVGFILGMIFGWVFFLYHFGLVHDKLIMDINELKTTIVKQENTIETLRKEDNERNEEMKKNLTVQDIKIEFTNEDDVNLSELALHELRGAVENLLESVRNQNIETVAISKDFLESTVENKTFGINDKEYQLRMEKLILFTTIEMNLRIETAE
ncbi:hypothetical protein QA612_05745 [Evansella sp. AB-P1]|uniref:sporulation membrane protein YtrI n=1 Tax=Evansella sp. AB-P1 TaxID=3037653 RepID=UPI00241CCEC4|nr:sporulation membrane protein YtrI [Evansella sp. AB-P1]MDG5786988.1 hypothetical protein [Evansella sp. AB-P1]